MAGEPAAAAVAVKQNYGFPLTVLGKHTQARTQTGTRTDIHTHTLVFTLTHTWVFENISRTYP